MTQTRRLPLAALLIVALCSTAAHAERTRAPRVDRQAAFKASLSLDGWRKQERFLPANKVGKALPKLQTGVIKVKALGNVIVMRRYQPATKGGERGFQVEQWVRLRQKPATTDKLSGKAHESLTQAIALLDKNFALAPTNRRALLDAAVSGVLANDARPVTSTEGYRLAVQNAAASLNDKYTRSFAPAAEKQRVLSSAGQAEGIGVVMLRGQDGVVARIHDKAPAAGQLQPRDRILSIDGRPAGTNQQIWDALKGDAGTRASLRVQRGSQTLTLSIERKQFPIQQVFPKLLGKSGIGMIKLARFTDGCAGDVQKAISKLQRQNKAPLKGLVLDLRGNGGGSSVEATKLLDGFISRGVFVNYVGANPEQAVATNKTPFAGLKLAVLLDKDSASASERTAGVLKQHNRATILGDVSFGKGIQQRTYGLPDGSSLKVTVAKMLLPSPSGGPVLDYHTHGIVPHVTAAQAKARFPQSPDPTASYAAYLLSTQGR